MSVSPAAYGQTAGTAVGTLRLAGSSGAEKRDMFEADPYFLGSIRALPGQARHYQLLSSIQNLLG